jgi:hypothetical protein
MLEQGNSINMRANLLLWLSICLVLGLGTVTADSSLNLTGTWTEEKIDGFQYSGERFNATIEGEYWIIIQQDNLISGTNYFNDSTQIVQEPIAGVISPDGKTVNIVDSSGGTYLAYVSDDDTLIVNYLNTGDKKAESNYAFAFYQVLKREN